MAVVIGPDATRRAFLKTGAVALGAMLMPAESSGDAVLERRIPKTGESVPAIGLGTGRLCDVAGVAAEMTRARTRSKPSSAWAPVSSTAPRCTDRPNR